MKAVTADTKRQQKEFLSFRKELYRRDSLYVDNNYYMLKEIFSGKLNFTKDMDIYPLSITDGGKMLCQGVAACTKELPEYMQLCFFEARPDCGKAVELLVKKTAELGKKHGCKRIVIGLYGHVNYGLGFLDSHFEEKNSFSSPANPKYYNEYFREMGCEEIKLNSYITHTLDNRLSRYRSLLAKLDRTYSFRCFDKREFRKYSEIYTDLNNACFAEHRYYYRRKYSDDEEMLRTLFLFMKEDSLIFAFKDDIPVGFILWYPDYNELAEKGSIFGTKHFFLNLLRGRSIKTAKVMEYGVLDGYRGSGLPLALINKVYDTLRDYGCTRVETSWILDENTDSNSFCTELCDSAYKSYVVYEKEIG